MELSINVFKKEGAKKVYVRPTQTIRDLVKYKTLNSHGLEEIILNMDNLMIQGSGSFAERVDEILTEYSLKINKHKLKKDAFNKCKLDSICKNYIESDSIMINKIYNQITK